MSKSTYATKLREMMDVLTTFGIIVFIAVFVLMARNIVSRFNRPKQRVKEIGNVKYYLLSNKKVS